MLRDVFDWILALFGLLQGTEGGNEGLPAEFSGMSTYSSDANKDAPSRGKKIGDYSLLLLKAVIAIVLISLIIYGCYLAFWAFLAGG
jgi:hypothetical protein